MIIMILGYIALSIIVFSVISTYLDNVKKDYPEGVKYTVLIIGTIFSPVVIFFLAMLIIPVLFRTIKGER